MWERLMDPRSDWVSTCMAPMKGPLHMEETKLKRDTVPPNQGALLNC